MRVDRVRAIAVRLAPLAAGAGYGGWAGIVNAADGNPSWPLVALSHGAYAAALTALAERLTRRLRRHHSAPATFLGMSALTVLLPLAIQLLVGNTRIGLSLAPGIVLGHLYLLAVLADARPRAGAPGLATAGERYAER